MTKETSDLPERTAFSSGLAEGPLTSRVLDNEVLHSQGPIDQTFFFGTGYIESAWASTSPRTPYGLPLPQSSIVLRFTKFYKNRVAWEVAAAVDFDGLFGLA
jgi:hypothetical protein